MDEREVEKLIRWNGAEGGVFIAHGLEHVDVRLLGGKKIGSSVSSHRAIRIFQTVHVGSKDVPKGESEYYGDDRDAFSIHGA